MAEKFPRIPRGLLLALGVNFFMFMFNVTLMVIEAEPILLLFSFITACSTMYLVNLAAKYLKE